MIYLPEEGIWRAASAGAHGYEIIIAGDAFAPSAEHAALLDRVGPQIDALAARARQYLDCFARRPEGEEWFLESLDLTGTATSFELAFTLDSDINGDWRVTFIESVDGFSPVEFGRRQV